MRAATDSTRHYHTNSFLNVHVIFHDQQDTINVCVYISPISPSAISSFASYFNFNCRPNCPLVGSILNPLLYYLVETQGYQHGPHLIFVPFFFGSCLVLCLICIQAHFYEFCFVFVFVFLFLGFSTPSIASFHDFIFIFIFFNFKCDNIYTHIYI